MLCAYELITHFFVFHYITLRHGFNRVVIPGISNHLFSVNIICYYIRHPMYAAFWLWGIAQALLLHNWICGLSYLISFLPMYVFRVPQEEQMMLDTFKQQYKQYMARTSRILPKFFPQSD